MRRFVNKRFDLLTPSAHQGSSRGAALAGRKYCYVDGPESIDAKPALKIIDDALVGEAAEITLTELIEP